MSLNIRKSSKQRVFEHILKSVRKNDSPFGIVVPDTGGLPSKATAKRDLIHAVSLIGAQVYGEVKSISSWEHRTAAYNKALDTALAELAPSHRLKYTPPGGTMRA